MPWWFFPSTRGVIETARELKDPNLALVGLGVIAAPFIDLFCMTFVGVIQTAALPLRSLGWLTIRASRIGV